MLSAHLESVNVGSEELFCATDNGRLKALNVDLEDENVLLVHVWMLLHPVIDAPHRGNHFCHVTAPNVQCCSLLSGSRIVHLAMRCKQRCVAGLRSNPRTIEHELIGGEVVENSAFSNTIAVEGDWFKGDDTVALRERRHRVHAHVGSNVDHRHPLGYLGEHLCHFVIVPERTLWLVPECVNHKPLEHLAAERNHLPPGRFWPIFHTRAAHCHEPCRVCRLEHWNDTIRFDAAINNTIDSKDGLKRCRTSLVELVHHTTKAGQLQRILL
mmetsp:Transcript_14531/g.31528  ORF Transcript_14531/g.31528 Transcript_14531/m.31528 type:complete len:269 (+) Transcript_14531:372-1178(+)